MTRPPSPKAISSARPALLSRSSMDPASDVRQAAAGIAHDLRNVVLVPISARIEMADRALRRGDVARARSLLAEMNGVIRHAEAALERLRDHRRPDARREPVAIEALAMQAAELVEHRHAIQLDLRGIGDADLDPHDVVAALVNLLVNAIDAGAPTVRLATGRGPTEVWFEVSDTGPGVPDALRAHLFEPGVSSSSSDARGLGLAMVAACARRHGGTVDVTSTRGATTFRLTLRADPGP